MTEELGKKPDNENKTYNGNGSKRRKAGLVLLVVIVAVAIAGFYFWHKSQVEVSTDDAFIHAHVHRISSRIPGHVKEVLVEDNQQAAKGSLLVTLDPSDYEAKVKEAEGALLEAKNETSSDFARVEEARAALHRYQAQLKQADLDLKRGKALFKKNVLPKERLDRLRTAKDVAAAQLRQANQALAYAQARLGEGPQGKRAQIMRREAELELARLNLSYTKIYAPIDGYVTGKSIEIGTNIQPGQPLMALVELSEPWIVANYKESQLTHIEPGQKVLFTVDAYPGRKFRGRVGSIMAGTGAAFSLLPPENASGNYVKVVQRVPVKILIDESSDPKHLLRVGMSVVPTILTGRSLGDILRTLNPF